MSLSRHAVKVLAVSLVVLSMSVSFGQDYPSKPIRILTSGAGGGGDFIARQIAQGISGPLGQPVIVDNRGNAVLAAEAATKSPGDGYTINVGGATLWVQPLLQKAPFDMADLAPISLITREVNVLVVHPSLPAKSVKELIAFAKARSGELNYSSGATGTGSHLAMELFKSMAGVNIVNVPYKAAAPAVTGLVSGEVQLTIYDAGLVAPLVKSGKLRALAVTSAEPTALVPGLPTVAGSGLPGYEAVNMTGLFAPVKTPGAIISRLNQETVRVLNRPEVKERLLNAGADAVGSTPEQFGATIKTEIAKWAKVIKDAGIKASN